MLEIIPAVDVKGGRCVRLVQGQMDKETLYFDDPLEAAKLWVSQGARRIHVVDLDGAVAGTRLGDPNIGNASTNMQIGGNPQAGGRAWDGLIDDVAIWDRALTAGEVSLIWNNGDGASIGSFAVVIPEPMTMLAVGLSVAGLGGYIRKRRRG